MVLAKTPAEMRIPADAKGSLFQKVGEKEGTEYLVWKKYDDVSRKGNRME